MAGLILLTCNGDQTEHTDAGFAVAAWANCNPGKTKTNGALRSAQARRAVN